MGSAARICDLLPSLWRPEEDEISLLTALIGAAASRLDQAHVEAGETMQAHWATFSDSALLSSFVAASRQRSHQRPLLPGDAEVELNPFINDLARLTSLLGLAPFTEPLDARETVEAFRRRVFATVQLWQDAIATRAGLLGAARLSLSGVSDRGLHLEEFAPAAPIFHQVEMPGIPEALVGPLMRWRVDARALLPTPIEVYIQGVATVEGKIDPTENPVIEMFDPATGTGTGLAYEGKLAEGEALALLPTHSSWLAVGGTVQSSTALPTATESADPTAAGPWAAVDQGPDSTVRDFAQTADGALWAAVAADGAGALWRLTAAKWEKLFDGLPEVFCLLADGDSLLVGHSNGLSRLAIFADALSLEPEPSNGEGPAVRALARGTERIWAATATGAARVTARGTLKAVGPGARAANHTPFCAVHVDPDGIIHFGGDVGLFRYDEARNQWHAYHGEAVDELVADWSPWVPADALPTDAEVFLPTVTSLLRGPDMSLWIGTTRGLARYRARARRGAYSTRLEAFPELGVGIVHTLALDERQQLWVGSDRGLLVCDGSHWFQARDGALVRLAQPIEQGGYSWRFDRAGDAWERAIPGDAGGFSEQTPMPVTTDEDDVTAITWTDGAIAQLGALSPEGQFTADHTLVPGQLRRRLKPDPTKIFDGFLPSLPRVGPAVADFRYLALEDDLPPPTAFPAWTREGRLMPPPKTAAAPAEGRYLQAEALRLIDTVFSFNPAARVSLRWRPRAALSVTARLERESPDETLPAVVLDRVAAAMDMVRPAGARVRLAHGETVVRGGEHG